MKRNQKLTLEHVKLEIVPDPYAENPRDANDCLSRFYSPSSRRFTTGGKKDFEISELLSGHPNLLRTVRRLKRDGAVVVEFNNPNVGTCFAVIERSDIFREYGNVSRSSLYHARQAAKGEIEEYLAWANGETYGVEITDAHTGELLDSCYGYYGEESARSEGERQAAYFEEQYIEFGKHIDERLAAVTQ